MTKAEIFSHLTMKKWNVYFTQSTRKCDGRQQFYLLSLFSTKEKIVVFDMTKEKVFLHPQEKLGNPASDHR